MADRGRVAGVRSGVLGLRPSPAPPLPSPAMRATLSHLSPVLHLTRVTTAFAAVGNVWFVILWTRANPEEVPHGTVAERSLWLMLLGGAIAAVGLYAFGSCLNDVLDARRDRAVRPDWPMAAGRLSVESAVTIIGVTLIASVLGSTVFGIEGVLLTLVLLGAVLFFNAAGKFVPAIGLVVLGLIYAGHMLVPNVQLRFLWPVWVVMTHAMIVAGLAHHLGRKVPPLTRRAVGVAALGWVFWTVVLAGVTWRRAAEGEGLWPSWVPPSAAVWIVMVALGFVLLCWRRVLIFGPGPRVAEKIGRYGALWLPLYGCAWLLGSGHVKESLLLGALAMMGFLGMTTLRELYAMLEQPVGYRR